MSRKHRMNNRHNLENEKPTRKSARLNNSKNDYFEFQAQEKKTRANFRRNINTCAVMFTRSRGRCVEHDVCFPKPDESSITEENGTETTSDSDGNFVKTLTYSSSDSNASKRNTSKRSNVRSSSCGLQNLIDKKTVDGKESSEKENEEAPNVEGMTSLTNQRGYNLRSKSKKQVAVESGSDTSSVIEEKHVVTKKAQKIGLKDKKNENNTKHSGLDTDGPKLQALKQFAKPSFLRTDQGKGVKKSKEKKTGTLARKRELRDMLEHQDEGYEDDAFEGTPFRNIRPVIKYKLSPIIFDTSIHSSSSDSEFKTPCSRTPVNRLRPAGPLSTGTSDSDTGIMTPGLLNSVNRNDIDRYVNRLKRRNIRLGCKTKIKSRTPLVKKQYRIIQTRKSFDFDTNCSVQKSATTESEYCEEDYYWSDME